MEQRHLDKSPIQRVLPKLMIMEALFILPGIACIIMVPEIGLFIGIGLIFIGGMLSGIGMVNAIRRSPCQECGRPCRLEMPEQKRVCDVCEIEWLLPKQQGTQSEDAP